MSPYKITIYAHFRHEITVVGVTDHEEANGEVPVPPRVPQEDLGHPGVPQVHLLGHGEGLEGWIWHGGGIGH